MSWSNHSQLQGPWYFTRNSTQSQIFHAFHPWMGFFLRWDTFTWPIIPSLDQSTNQNSPHTFTLTRFSLMECMISMQPISKVGLGSSLSRSPPAAGVGRKWVWGILSLCFSVKLPFLALLKSFLGHHSSWLWGKELRDHWLGWMWCLLNTGVQYTCPPWAHYEPSKAPLLYSKSRQ